MPLDMRPFLAYILNVHPKASWALTAYAKRWEIESLFKALKSSGFNLEDTHLTDIDRISTLVAVVSLAFLWALKVGHWLHKKTPIRVLAHGRPAKSLFRLGLDFIRRAITNLTLDSKLVVYLANHYKKVSQRMLRRCGQVLVRVSRAFFRCHKKWQCSKGHVWKVWKVVTLRVCNEKRLFN